MYIYETIANDIIEDILDKKLAPGQRLPSEQDLIAQYQTSKMTVRRAYQTLKDMDVVVSKQGSGIFIKDHRKNNSTNNHYLSGYTLMAILRGFNPKLTDLKIKHRFADLNLANTLAIKINDSILQVERTRTINNRRVSFEVAYIPKDRLNNFNEDELKDSIHRFMAKHADDNLVLSSRFYSAVIPQEYLQSKLDLDEHEAVFVIEQVSSDSENVPLLYIKSFQSGKMINI